MKYTQHTLDKIEAIAEEAKYKIRYERGSFQSGFCILEDKKVVVLNKFLALEGRINTLIDLLPALQVDANALTPGSAKLFKEIMSRVAVSMEVSEAENESEPDEQTEASLQEGTPSNT